MNMPSLSKETGDNSDLSIGDLQSAQCIHEHVQISVAVLNMMVMMRPSVFPPFPLLHKSIWCN